MAVAVGMSKLLPGDGDSDSNCLASVIHGMLHPVCSLSFAPKVPQGQCSPHGVSQPYLALHSCTLILDSPWSVLSILFESAKSLMISSSGCQPQEEIKSFYVLSLAYMHISSCALLSDSQTSSNEGEQIRHTQRCLRVKGKETFSCTNVVHKARREWRKAVSILLGLWDVLK